MNTTENQTAKIEATKLGEYVKTKADSSKVYKRGHYDRASKSYSLQDCDDMNREIFVKRGRTVFVGFTY
jgi:hypothetical protein